MSTNLLKNPILRNKMNINVKNPAGDLIQEINEQDLSGQAGGTNPTVTTVIITPTPALKCGYLLTVSAECSGGTPCA